MSSAIPQNKDVQVHPKVLKQHQWVAGSITDIIQEASARPDFEKHKRLLGTILGPAISTFKEGYIQELDHVPLFVWFIEDEVGLGCTVYVVDHFAEDGKTLAQEPKTVPRLDQFQEGSAALQTMLTFMLDFPDALFTTKDHEIIVLVPSENKSQRLPFSSNNLQKLADRGYNKFDLVLMRR